LPIREGLPIAEVSFPKNSWIDNDNVCFSVCYLGDLYKRGLRRLNITRGAVERVTDYEGMVPGIVGKSYLIFLDKKRTLQQRDLHDGKIRRIASSVRHFDIQDKTVLALKGQKEGHAEILLYDPFCRSKETLVKDDIAGIVSFWPSDNEIYYITRDKCLYQFRIGSKQKTQLAFFGEQSEKRMK
jgi:hypothetical protein